MCQRRLSKLGKQVAGKRGKDSQEPEGQNCGGRLRYPSIKGDWRHCKLQNAMRKSRFNEG